MKKFGFILIVLIAAGCEEDDICNDIIEENYYSNDSVMTRVISDCKGVLKSFEHLNIDGDNCFKIDYTKINSNKCYIGKPWIHQIWNESIYEVGDTILFYIDVSKPPNFDLILTINGKEIKNQKKMRQGMSVYEFSRIKEMDNEKLQMKVVYYLDGIKWITFKRSIDL